MPDDDDLWHAVARTVTPLGDRKTPELPKNTRPIVRRPRQHEIDERIVFGGGAADVDHGGPAQTGMGKRERRRISQGSTEVERVIDLHNDTKEAAYRRLCRDIPSARARGERLILVITGKGGRRFSGADDTPIAHRRREDFELGEGVLRAALPEWLRGADLNPHVASYSSAAQHHGGDGAFYVRLRGKDRGS